MWRLREFASVLVCFRLTSLEWYEPPVMAKHPGQGLVKCHIFLLFHLDDLLDRLERPEVMFRYLTFPHRWSWLGRRVRL